MVECISLERGTWLPLRGLVPLLDLPQDKSRDFVFGNIGGVKGFGCESGCPEASDNCALRSLSHPSPGPVAACATHPREAFSPLRIRSCSDYLVRGCGFEVLIEVIVLFGLRVLQMYPYFNVADWAPDGPGWTRGTQTSAQGPGIFRYVVLANLQDGTSREDIRAAMSPFGTVLEVIINGPMGYVRYPLEADVVRVTNDLSARGSLPVGRGRCRAFGRMSGVFGVSRIPVS